MNHLPGVYNRNPIRLSGIQMSELILFTLNAIVIYLVSDWILRIIEKRRGAVLKQRQVIFFVIFLVLVMTSFGILRNLLGPA